MDFIGDLKGGYSTLKVTRNQRKEVRCTEIKKTSILPRTIATTMPLLLTPTVAFADTFGDIHNTVMTMFDGGVVLIIIFAGASWALGHRSKAIELLIGVCCGYLLARHAVDIRDYLKSIGGGS